MAGRLDLSFLYQTRTILRVSKRAPSSVLRSVSTQQHRDASAEDGQKGRPKDSFVRGKVHEANWSPMVSKGDETSSGTTNNSTITATERRAFETILRFAPKQNQAKVAKRPSPYAEAADTDIENILKIFTSSVRNHQAEKDVPQPEGKSDSEVAVGVAGVEKAPVVSKERGKAPLSTPVQDNDQFNRSFKPFTTEEPEFQASEQAPVVSRARGKAPVSTPVQDSDRSNRQSKTFTTEEPEFQASEQVQADMQTTQRREPQRNGQVRLSSGRLLSKKLPIPRRVAKSMLSEKPPVKTEIGMQPEQWTPFTLRSALKLGTGDVPYDWSAAAAKKRANEPNATTETSNVNQQEAPHTAPALEEEEVGSTIAAAPIEEESTLRRSGSAPAPASHVTPAPIKVREPEPEPSKHEGIFRQPLSDTATLNITSIFGPGPGPESFKQQDILEQSLSDTAIPSFPSRQLDDSIQQALRQRMHSISEDLYAATSSTSKRGDMAVWEVIEMQIFPMAKNLQPQSTGQSPRTEREPPFGGISKFTFSREKSDDPRQLIEAAERERQVGVPTSTSSSNPSPAVVDLPATATTEASNDTGIGSSAPASTKTPVTPLIPETPAMSQKERTILQHAYPASLLLALRLYITHFPTSPYPFLLLPRIRSLGTTSYVLGASPEFYNSLMSLVWMVRSSLREVDALLGEMERGGVEMDEGTYAVLRGIEEERARDLEDEQKSVSKNAEKRESCIKGSRGASFWKRQQMWFPRVLNWVDVIAGRLAAKERLDLN